MMNIAKGGTIVYYKVNFQTAEDRLLEMLEKGKVELADAIRGLCEMGNTPTIHAVWTYCSDATRVPVTEIKIDKIGKRMICVFPEGRW